MKEQNYLKYNKQQNLVSIILPTYNSEKYIEKCLKSISNQSYKNFELIVVDGFSNDSTIDKISKYKYKMNIKILQIKTQNLAQALNYGISNCKGEFIARMDSDDIMTPNRILKQINFFKNKSFEGVLGTQAIRFNSSYFKPFVINSLNVYLKLDLLFGSPFIHPTVMFDRKIFEQGFFYNSEFNECEDFELWSRLSNKYSFHNLKIPYLLYRVHQYSASNLKSEKLSEYKQRIIENNLKKLNINLNDKKLYMYLKIISLKLNKNDNFIELNDNFLEVLYLIYNSSKNIKVDKNTLRYFLRKKYFRFCLRSLLTKNFSFDILDNSIFKIDFLKILILKILRIIKLPL